jgi:hypothetical protein
MRSPPLDEPAPGTDSLKPHLPSHRRRQLRRTAHGLGQRPAQIASVCSSVDAGSGAEAQGAPTARAGAAARTFVTSNNQPGQKSSKQSLSVCDIVLLN